MKLLIAVGTPRPVYCARNKSNDAVQNKNSNISIISVTFGAYHYSEQTIKKN